MSKQIVTLPLAEPILLSEAKTQRRVTVNDDDAELTRLIKVARQHVEQETGRALITQIWDLYLEEFPQKEPYAIEIPLPPLQGIASIKYIDSDGNQQTLATSEYTVDDKCEPARVVPGYGKSWPATRDEPNAVEIRFTAGYGDASTDVPEDIRNAMFLLIGEWHERTEEAVVGTVISKIPRGVQSLLAPHKVHYL